MISDNIKRLRENMGLSQAALAASWGNARQRQCVGNGVILPHSSLHLVEMAQLFHTTTDDIPRPGKRRKISLRGMNEQEKRLVYDLVDYISGHHKP